MIILTALAFNLLGDALNDLAGPQGPGTLEAFATSRRRGVVHAPRAPLPDPGDGAVAAPPRDLDAAAPLLDVAGLTVAFPGHDGPAVVVDDVSLHLDAARPSRSSANQAAGRR